MPNRVISWASTLRLPKSGFPVRPLPGDQANLLQRCTDDYYEWQRNTTSKPFILHDGPPYANGNLHIGHALNKILKDIICRVEVSRGKSVQYIPGWDCHGLPIELKALETKNVESNPLSIRKVARQLAQRTVKEQKEEFKSWAVTGDWSRAWTTMDPKFEIKQLKVFEKMMKNGLIHRQKKPVYWSPSSRTALAEAELEYHDDHVSLSAMIKLPVDGSFQTETWSFFGASIAIWTTTPWTLPANMAVAFHRDIEYLVVSSVRHGKLIISSNRKEFVELSIGEELEVLDRFRGSVFEEQPILYSPPFRSKGTRRSLVHADFVTSDTGTGFVHCAPGHGMEDYEVLLPQIRSNQITVSAPVDDEGRFVGDDLPKAAQYLHGQDVLKDGNGSVVEYLRRKGLLLATKAYQHKYPYDWRTKEPIIVRATSQWFADVSTMKEEVLTALDNVKFHPESAEKRLKSFVQNRTEWCISRQRSWGLPIPVLYNETTGEPHLSAESIAYVIKVLEERGTDAWWSDPEGNNSWILPIDRSSDVHYVRGKDTMDVWFDSGSSWTQLDIGSENENSGPGKGAIDVEPENVADLYIEGTDQHRGWFQSSLLTYVAYSYDSKYELVAPYKSLITHGFTLDRFGKKMSKSMGNVISPMDIIQGAAISNRSKKQTSLGADLLRLWVANCDFTKDVSVNPTILENVQSFLHKYRVTFKLLLGVLEDFDPRKHMVEYNQLYLIDQLAIWRLSIVANAVRQAYKGYEFHHAVAAINQFVNSDLSAFYVESIKDRLYCSKPDDRARRAVQSVLFSVLWEMQAMLTPLTPLLVEETSQYSPDSLRSSLLASKARLETLVSPPTPRWLKNLWSYLQPINKTVKAVQEKARSEKCMGSSLESYVRIEIPAGDSETFEVLGSDDSRRTLKDMLVVSGLDVIQGSKEEELWAYHAKVTTPHETLVRVVVHAPPDNISKCARCWQYNVDAGVVENEAENLCDRCIDVVS